MKTLNKNYLKEKISKLNIYAVSTLVLALLFAGHLAFKKNPEKEKVPIKPDRPMAELSSVNLHKDFGDYFFAVNDAPIDYLILKNEPAKYLNLEIIAEHYPESKSFIPMAEKSIREHRDIFYLDPVIVLGLMNAESAYDPYAISVAGAAGLMQLMPETAEEMGLKIYKGNWGIYQALKEARKNIAKTNKSAVREGRRGNYEESKRLFKEYNFYEAEAELLYQEYKRTLIENKNLDERLNPEKNIWAGVKYLATLAKLNMEDPNIAGLRDIIAAYNFRGESAAKEWTLPTLKEPINHLNKVGEFYRRFKLLARESPVIYVE